MIVDENLEDALGAFADQYGTLRKHIATVHKDTTAGASAVDGGLLTDHGPEHINMVIRRASHLIMSEKCHLSAYEIFLLLAAIHLHDVGNILGRADHQFRAKDVADWLGSSVSPDTIVRRNIAQIASAHTSGNSEDKDTISKLAPKDYILNELVRPRLLASILRFADELADDRSRASRFLLETEALPPGSEVHHAFAYALHSTVIDHDAREVQLFFELERGTAMRKMEKNKSQVFLLDEILLRSAKLHRERVYAMLFMRDCIPIEAIRVSIHVYGDGLDPVEKIGYRLADVGYPAETAAGVYSIAPELSSYSDWNGKRLDGKTLANRLLERK